MKILLLLLFFISPLKEVENVIIAFPSTARQDIQQHELFFDYKNGNFSQQITWDKNRVIAKITSINYIHLNLDNYRVILDKKKLARFDSKTREFVISLYDGSVTLHHYFKNISTFLEESLEYTEEKLPQDASTVIINRKANCVGYANLAAFLLDCVGIKNKVARGFYLLEENERLFQPIPHQWIEIELADGLRFFYDPQRQRFSSHYIVTRDDIDFRKIKKFKILLVKKSKRILN